jgi:hypothetical protein
MRTIQQITEIQKHETPPVVISNALTSSKVQLLLNYYRNSDKTLEKNTGPKVLYINEGDGIIDDIIAKLRTRFGDFKVRSAHYFDVNSPHIIHNDDDKDLPKCYKAFTIPLWCNGDDDDIGLVMYDQFYYHGPAKFINGETQQSSVHYNQFVREYRNVDYTTSDLIEDTSQITHLREHWLKGLSVYKILPWKIGSILAFESLRLHSSTDFVSKEIDQKIGISIFTTI